MNKTAITIKNLHIMYQSLEKTSIKKTCFRKHKKKQGFEALKGVSLKIPEGEIVGIIGRNGSGKSTLLRAIAGIFSPNSGKIDIHGNTVSLLSIGVGFNKKLSGYENIYLSGLLLGFSEKEIREKEKEIIDFAELGEFIYKPVQEYSSGMYSKLAFAITATLETDITLIDEVLSVGDEYFKKKSYSRMREIISADYRTVVIVSHNLDTISELCDRVVWLHDGEIKKVGKTDEVIKKYKESMEVKNGKK